MAAQYVFFLMVLIGLSLARKNIDFDKLAKEWEEGDEASELIAEHEVLAQAAAKRGIGAFPTMGGPGETPFMDFDKMDPNKILDDLNKDPLAYTNGHANSVNGDKNAKSAKRKAKSQPIKKKKAKKSKNPTLIMKPEGVMMFIELTEPIPNKKDREELGSLWTNMLHNAAIVAHVYDVGEKTVLFRSEKGWDLNGMMKFALSQPNVAHVTYESKEYRASDWDDLDEL